MKHGALVEAALLDQQRRILKAKGPLEGRGRYRRKGAQVACACGLTLSLAENRYKPTWVCRGCREKCRGER